MKTKLITISIFCTSFLLNLTSCTNNNKKAEDETIKIFILLVALNPVKTGTSFPQVRIVNNSGTTQNYGIYDNVCGSFSTSYNLFGAVTNGTTTSYQYATAGSMYINDCISVIKWSSGPFIFKENIKYTCTSTQGVNCVAD